MVRRRALRRGWKTGLGAAAAALLVCAGAAGLYSENITLTTAYPSPAGIYRNLTTTRDAWLARDEGDVHIGEKQADRPGFRLRVWGRVAADHAARLNSGYSIKKDGDLKWSALVTGGSDDLSFWEGGDKPWVIFKRGGAVELNGSRTNLLGLDGTDTHWIMAGGTREGTDNAMGFNPKKKEISPGPGWSLLGGGVITGSYVGDGIAMRNIVVPGISSSRPIKALVLILGQNREASLLIKSDTMPGTEHYFNGGDEQASRYRSGSEPVSLNTSGFTLVTPREATNQAGRVYHFIAMAGGSQP